MTDQPKIDVPDDLSGITVLPGEARFLRAMNIGIAESLLDGGEQGDRFVAMRLEHELVDADAPDPQRLQVFMRPEQVVDLCAAFHCEFGPLFTMQVMAQVFSGIDITVEDDGT